MTFFELYGLIGLVILGLMVLLWLLSLAVRDTSIVDIFWGFGFVVAVWAGMLFSPAPPDLRRWLLSALVTIWGLRLSIHIGLRNIGKGEDFRYAKWRAENGKRWWWYSFFQTFLLQGFLMWLVSAPLTAVHLSSAGSFPIWLDILAMLLWAYGFFFEAVGDAQLTAFKKNPANKGQLLRSGVWRYTRHPNYFGDAAQWWGFYLLALAAGGWWSIFSPILMTFLLLRVSGVALLEKTLASEKPGYREYIETTSAFVPWFPKKPAKGA